MTEIYSTKEAAEKLDLSHEYVRLLVRKAIIEDKQIGHDWVVLDLNYRMRRRPGGGRKKA